MILKPEEIETITEEILSSKMSVDDKQSYFATRYKDFYESYPILFEMCCKPKNPENTKRLTYMISMLKNIEQNKMTQHIASVNVGQKLYNDFVKPTIDEKS